MECRWIGYAGRLCERRDCQQLWDALRAIEADHPEVRPQTGEAVALFYQDSKSLKTIWSRCCKLMKAPMGLPIN